MEENKLKRFNKIYPWFAGLSSDLLFWVAIDTLFLTVVKNCTASQIVSLTSISMIINILLQVPLELYNSLIKKDTKKYGYILESGQLHPKIVKEMVDYNNTVIVCLGLGNLSVEDMVNQCIEHDKKEDWTYGLSREYLRKHAIDWYNTNEMLKEECPKYGIEYFDTSKNRVETLNNILDKIIEQAQESR